MAISISSGAEQVLHIADAVLHPLLMEHPDWSPTFDLLSDQAATTKRRLLDRAAADKALVFAYHIPFPSVGQVLPHGQGWRRHPLTAPAPDSAMAQPQPR